MRLARRLKRDVHALPMTQTGRARESLAFAFGDDEARAISCVCVRLTVPQLVPQCCLAYS